MASTPSPNRKARPQHSPFVVCSLDVLPLRSQLRKGLVTQCPVSCCPGETRLLLYTLSNPLPREAIFSLTISHPQLLQPIEQRQELQLLKAALDQSCVVQVGGSGSSSGSSGSPSKAQGAAAVTPLHELASRQLGGGQQQEGKPGIQEQLSSGCKIFLAANESVVVPFKYVLPRTARSPLSRQQGSGGAGGSSGSGEAGSSWWLEQHTVTVEFIPEGHSHPAAVLELLVSTRAGCRAAAALMGRFRHRQQASGVEGHFAACLALLMLSTLSCWLHVQQARLSPRRRNTASMPQPIAAVTRWHSQPTAWTNHMLCCPVLCCPVLCCVVPVRLPPSPSLWTARCATTALSGTSSKCPCPSAAAPAAGQAAYQCLPRASPAWPQLVAVLSGLLCQTTNW